MKNKWVLLVSILIFLSIFAYFFSQFNIESNSLAIDWKNFYPSLQGGDIKYSSIEGILFPPWSLIPFLPLGLLSMQISWGLLAGISVFVLLFSIPQSKSKALYYFSIFILILSFPSLRNIADGNVEGIVIAGILLILFGNKSKNALASVIGVILVTIKFQEIYLFLIVWGVYVLLTWPYRKYLLTFASILVIVGISLLWRGETWLAVLIGAIQKYSNSIVNISMSATSERLGLPHLLFIIIWIIVLIITLFLAWRSHSNLSREFTGMLITSSLLLTPYAATNSVLTILAIGVLPLFHSNRFLGTILIILFNIPYLFSSVTLYNYQATYWTLVMFITWLTLSIRIQFPISNKGSIGNAS
jgi:hypothetical protein